MEGTGRRVEPPSSQRRVLGNVKNVAASTPLSTTGIRDQMKAMQLKPRPHSTDTPAARAVGEEQMEESAVPSDHTERDMMCTYLPLKDIYEDLIDEGPPECICKLYDDFTTSFPIDKASWSVFDELDDPKFRALWSDEKLAASKKARESVVPQDHTERDMMCTYLPLKDTYEDLIDEGPPECMCQLYDDFTTSFPSNESGQRSIFDELDDPTFRALWSDEKAAAYEAARASGSLPFSDGRPDCK